MLELKLATYKDAISISRMSAALIEYGLPKAWSPERIAHHIRRKDSVVLVAKAGEQIMGFAVMDFGEYIAHLNLFAVSTLARRHGIGRRMLEWLHQSAMTAGTFSIELEVRAANTTAIKFYASFGYRQCGFRPRYYVGREDAICMSIDLSIPTANPSEIHFPWRGIRTR